jgi:hypothetical protein
MFDWLRHLFRRSCRFDLSFDGRVRLCGDLGHVPGNGIRPAAVFGSPGKECEHCGYWMQISHDEFRQVFGVKFKKALSYTNEREAEWRRSSR